MTCMSATGVRRECRQSLMAKTRNTAVGTPVEVRTSASVTFHACCRFTRRVSQASWSTSTVAAWECLLALVQGLPARIGGQYVGEAADPDVLPCRISAQ